nr:hypothetical protein [Tanacetum cinerariifolium]
MLNSSTSIPIFEESDNSLLDNSLSKFETFSDHTEETRSGSTTAHDSLPEYDSFCFEIEPDQERLTSVVTKDISINSTNDPLLEEVELFLALDNSIPPGIKNFGYDSERDIHFLEELLYDNSISFLENESSNLDHHDNPSFPRPPPEPPDVEFFFDLEPNSGEVISAVMNNIDELIEDECFDQGGEINVFANVKDDDYFPFIFVILIFLPYFIYPEAQCDDLIKQVNTKSAKNSDLNASLQEKALVITALKDTLSKLKGKAVVDEAVTLHPVDPELLRIDEIVENERLLNPLNTSLDYACKYTKRIQELLIILKQTCLCINDLGVNLPTSASGSQPQGNTKKDRIHQTQSRAKKNKLEAYPRNNVNSDLKCAACNGCLFSDNHDYCVLEFINSVNARVKSKSAKKPMNRKFWKPTRKVFTTIRYKWRPTGRIFTIVGTVFSLTRITTTAIVPLRKHIPLESNTSKPMVVQIVLWYLDSGCSKHMTGYRSQLTNLINKFLGTVKFGNDHVAKITGYGDYKIRNVTISRVYFVEGLRHNLFSVGQFCDSNLEVAFRQHTCFIRKFR